MGIKEWLVEKATDIADVDNDGDIDFQDLLAFGQEAIIKAKLREVQTALETKLAGKIGDRLCPEDGAAGEQHQREWVESCVRTADSDGWDSTASDELKAFYDGEDIPADKHRAVVVEAITMGVRRASVGVELRAVREIKDLLHEAAEEVGIGL